MTRKGICLIAALLIPVLVAESRADFLIYRFGAKTKQPQRGGQRGGGQPGQDPPEGPPGAPPGQPFSKPPEVVLSGRIAATAKLVTYTPLSSGSADQKLYFDPAEVTIKKAATVRDFYRKLMDKAGAKPDVVMEAALWALKKDLMLEFHDAIKKVLELDPKHEIALQIKDLKQTLDQQVPANPEIEKELRAAVAKSDMKVFSSKHFLLLCDTSDKAEKGHRKNRAKERLDLLEQVFERFVYLFQAHGIPIEVPREQMKVVLFKDAEDFNAIVAGLSRPPTCSYAYYDPIRNVSYFCDHGKSDMLKLIEKQHETLNENGDPVKKSGDQDAIRKARIIDGLLLLEKENCDLTAVSHVAPLQIAGNTGLLPHRVELPRWLQQGFSLYFETPVDAPWAGMGAVTEQRLKHYADFKDDSLHTNIDFIVGDQFFNYCRSIKSESSESAQAWALVHFLIEKQPQKCVAFLHKLGDMPADVTLTADLLLDLFSQVFGPDHNALDGELRNYAKALKTDMERLEGAEK